MQDEGSIKFITPRSQDWGTSDLRDRLQEIIGDPVALLDVSRAPGGFKVVFDTEDYAEEEATQMVIEAIASVFPDAAVVN